MLQTKQWDGFSILFTIYYSIYLCLRFSRIIVYFFNFEQRVEHFDTILKRTACHMPFTTITLNAAARARRCVTKEKKKP
jgi:hypothetical protein